MSRVEQGERLLDALRQLRPEDYTPAEWQDAACYLLSSGIQSALY